MYYYIVDPQQISQQQFERVQNILYSSLSEYKISGEVVRVTGLRTINQLVENAFLRDVKTLVVVGSEETLHDVVNAIKGRAVVLGFIPLVPSELGKIFGIRDIESAVKIIAQRRIAELDLGMVNQVYFLTKLTFGLSNNPLKGIIPKLDYPEFDINFRVNDQYRARLKTVGGEIINIQSDIGDGQLDVVLIPKLSNWSIFKNRKQLIRGNLASLPNASVVHANKIEMTGPVGLALKTFDRVLARAPVIVETIPKALKIIISKVRS